MKLRTLGELSNALDGDLSWRKKELTNLILLTSVDVAFTRASIAMLYAHWEGFVKTATESLVCYVKYQRLTFTDLQPCFITIGLKKSLDTLAATDSTAARSHAVSEIIDSLNSQARLPDNSVRTNGNLSSKVFAQIAEMIGISTSAYKTKYPVIDEQLLKKRNAIAHGEYLDVDEAAVQRVWESVRILLDTYRDDVYAVAAAGAFRRPLPSLAK